MRPLRSFRLRIALLSTCLSGLVLLLFGSWAWIMVHRDSAERIDDEIGRLANPYLDPRGFHRGLQEGFGVMPPGVSLFVIDAGGVILNQSGDWPEGLGPEDLPRADVAPGSPPPGGPRQGRDMADARPNGRPPWDGGPPTFRPGDREGGLGGPRRPGGPPPRPKPVFRTWRNGSDAWRVGVFATPRATLALALDLDVHLAAQRRVRNALVTAMLAGLVLVAAGGYLVAQRALRPLRLLSGTAEQITAKGLDARIPAGDEDVEFARLITVFNGMLARLERGFHQATRFSADAAHELKTPLTILQGNLEEGIQDAEAGSPEQARYGALLEEVQRLKSIVRKLLLLSKADAGQLPLSKKDVDFTEMVAEACQDIEALAPDLKLRLQIDPEIIVQGDSDLLRQVVQNLVTNAIRYNTGRGRIGVQLGQREGYVKMSVANTGQGIPEEDRERIFDRFQRIDTSRSRARGGAGLGLSLAREIARAHGGELSLESTPEDIVTFALRLPTDT